MLTGNTNTINWDFLKRLVDPQYNHTEIGGAHAGAEIGIDPTHNENAMNGLNGKQQTIKDRFIQRYTAENKDPQFIAESEKYLKEYIIEQYNKNPAIYNGVRLPLEYNPSEHQSRGAREAYFQNPWHTAYRYYVLTINNKPNPWLYHSAEYLKTQVDSAGIRYRCPEISAEQRALIRSMWVALDKGDFTLSPIYTKESAKLELIRTLASLGRAHNWDQTRPVMETYADGFGRQQTRQKTRIVNGVSQNVTEEYDDLKGDKPSCVWGGDTRLTQFIMLALQADPNEQELKSNDVRDKFREEMVSEAVGKNTLFGAIDAMDAESLTQLSEALENHIIMCQPFESLTPIQQSLMKQMQSYTTQDIAQFLNSCIMQWGAYRFTQRLHSKVEFQLKHFENYGQLALHFAKEPLGVFYEAIEQRIRTRLEGLNVNAAAADTVTEDIETLRAQLIELSMRLGDGAFLHYQTADEATIRQAAIRHRLQLARPEQAKAAIAEHKAREEARQAEIAHQAELRRQQEAAARQAELRRQQEEAARQAELRRQQEAAARQAELRRQQEEAEQDTLRQELLDLAFAHNDENLAARIFDFTLPQLRQEQQRQREEAARLAAEQQRLQQEEAVRLAAEQRRQQEEAVRIQAQRQAEAARLAAEQQLRQREAAARQATVQQAQPVLLAAYSNTRNGQSSNQASAPQVKADIAALFRTVEARQFLAMVNQSEALVKLLNQYTVAVAQPLANFMDAVKLNQINSANQATKEAFLNAFAQRKGLTLEAPGMPQARLLRVAS